MKEALQLVFKVSQPSQGSHGSLGTGTLGTGSWFCFSIQTERAVCTRVQWGEGDVPFALIVNLRGLGLPSEGGREICLPVPRTPFL